MANSVKIYGYPEFKSKSEAIRFLIKEGKLSNIQIIEKIGCTQQHIFLVKQKMKEKT
jgi:hypothetical protein